MAKPISLCTLARSLLHSEAPVSPESLAILHRKVVEEARARTLRRRYFVLLPLATAACFLLGWSFFFQPAMAPEAQRYSAVDNALDLLLLEEYGTSFDSTIASADRLLLFQEYPGCF